MRNDLMQECRSLITNEIRDEIEAKESINKLLVNALRLSQENFKILVESLIARMPNEWKKEHLKLFNFENSKVQ